MYPHRNRRSGGFTLIEVLLVLVILVVLASLAVVAYGPIQRRMNVNAAKTQVELIAQAVQQYQVTVNTFPPSLDALRSRPADVPEGKWDGPYLQRDIPPDPWNHPYQYQMPGQHNPDSFDVWTVSPDGQEIGNWTQELRGR
jgi:general secretion pathway protein G